ncbi:MAG: YfiR family protein [Acidobacteriota bacterium]
MRDRVGMIERPSKADVARRVWTGLLRVARLTCAVAALLSLPVVAGAQDVTEPALKAAFIYNFAIFTTWPAGTVPAAGPLVMCVIGDAAVGDALEQMVKGRVIAGRTITVSLVPVGGPRRVCHAEYVSGVTAGQLAQIIAGVRDAPVLTISDLDGFTTAGGIVQLFFENSRLRFNVKLESAKRADLQISSKLLVLSKPK